MFGVRSALGGVATGSDAHGIIPPPLIALDVPVQLADLDVWQIRSDVVSQDRVADMLGVGGEHIISECTQHEAILHT